MCPQLIKKSSTAAAGWRWLVLPCALITSLPAIAVTPYSTWMTDLSAKADPNDVYYHADPKIATDGAYIHVAWIATKKDWSGSRLFYARSSNYGVTFPLIKPLNINDESGLSFPVESSNLVANNGKVWVLFNNSSSGLFALRSADNGTNFPDQPQQWSNAYANFGTYVTALQNQMATVWARNDGNGGQPKDIFCTFSNDGGVTLNTTTLAHDDLGDGRVIWSYQVVDAIRSGNYVYALTVTQDENWISTQKHLLLWASENNCQSFKPPLQVNLPAVSGGYYLNSLQAAHYVPKLAAQGREVAVTWTNVDDPGNFDGWQQLSLRVRSSRDAGKTLQSPITLHDYPPGYSGTNGAQSGQETIARSGAKLHVATVFRAPAGTYVWSSTDGGRIFDDIRQVSNGGWWPILGMSSNTLQLVNSWFYRAQDITGSAWNGGVNPHYDFNGWTSPRFVLDSQGGGHYVAVSGLNYYDGHVLHRRLQPIMGGAEAHVVLGARTINGHPINDSVQIPATALNNFPAAMTVEFWVKRGMGQAYLYEDLLTKARPASTQGSYELGLIGSPARIYGRLVTTGSANPNVGDILVTTKPLYSQVWTHIAMTHEPARATNNWKIYVNGKLAKTGTLQGTLITDLRDAPLLLGLRGVGTGSVEMDELRLWQRELTDTEILHNLHLHLSGGEAGLIGLYRFDKDFRDATANANHATPLYKERFSTVGNPGDS